MISYSYVCLKVGSLLPKLLIDLLMQFAQVRLLLLWFEMASFDMLEVLGSHIAILITVIICW